MEFDINDKDFDKEVIEKSKQKPVIVDFWAPWCPPCQILKPILEKMIKQYGGKIILAKLNVEQNQQKARDYGVMSIPNVKLFKNGKVVDEFMGVMPEHKIREFIEDNIK